MVVVQVERSHEDFCLLCPHRQMGCSVSRLNNSTGIWLVQLVMAAEDVLALHAGWRADTRNFRNVVACNTVKRRCRCACSHTREKGSNEISGIGRDILLEARKELAQSFAPFSHIELAWCVVAVYCFPLRH